MDTKPILDYRNAQACCHLLSSGTANNSILGKFECSSLPGAIELFSIAARSQEGAPLRQEIRAAARDGVQPWFDIIHAWGDGFQSRPLGFKVQSLEFRRLGDGSGGESEELEGSLFEQRFRRSIAEGGFSHEAANWMARLFHEMIDNVSQHSGPSGAPASAIAGYQVLPDYFAFSVSDLGWGFHKSLTRSPDWSHLTDDSEALLAVIQKSASSRVGEGEGMGFKELFKALADRGALIRIRSGISLARVVATSTGREAELSTMGFAQGVHVSVCCQLGKETKERSLENSYCLNH
jgi:hypothetical protein